MLCPTLLLGPLSLVLGLTASFFLWLCRNLQAPEILYQEDYDVGDFFFLTLGFNLGYCCMFPNVLLQVPVAFEFTVQSMCYVSYVLVFSYPKTGYSQL